MNVALFLICLAKMTTIAHSRGGHGAGWRHRQPVAPGTASPESDVGPPQQPAGPRSRTWPEVEQCEDALLDRCLRECDADGHMIRGTVVCYESKHFSSKESFKRCSALFSQPHSPEAPCFPILPHPFHVHQFVPVHAGPSGFSDLIRNAATCVDNCRERVSCVDGCTAAPNERQRFAANQCHIDVDHSAKKEFLQCMQNRIGK